MRYLATSTTKRISKIGLGTWQFGARNGATASRTPRESRTASSAARLDLGVTLFDTAEIYGYGRSERILGQALGDDLTSVFLATKILPVLPLARSSSSAPWPARTGWAPATSTSIRCTSPTR